MEPKPTKIVAAKIAKGEFVLHQENSQCRVWNLFRQIKDLNGDKIEGFVYCQTCENVFNYKGPSTSKLVKHKCYIDKFIKRKESPLSIIDVESPSLEVPSVESIEYVNNHLLKLITKWVINDCKPYGVLQDAGLLTVFQEFISLGGKFGTGIDVDKFLPTSKTIERNVTEIYEQCFTRLKAEIAAVNENGFGLAADIWTNSYTKQSYIGLTIHFLKNVALRYCLLGFRLLDGVKCTTQNIYDTIETILGDFDCEFSNKSIIVTNSEGDVMKSLRNIKKIPSITLLLNKAIQQSMEEVTEAAGLVSACIKLFNYLKESDLDVKFGNSLQGLVPNRWKSIYKMLIFIENNWSEIGEALANQNEDQQIEAININYLKAVIKTLQPFDEAIEILEDVNEATLHLVLIYLHELKKSCETNDNEFKDFDFIERLKQHLQCHLEIIFTENITILHKIALFLYPPTNKLLPFDDQQKRCIADECRRLCLENEPKTTLKQGTEIPDSSAVKRYKLFSDFIEPEVNQDPDELISQELQCYKIMHIENSEDFDCFNWWQLHKDVFPFLYKLSCMILATPASSASTQQIFWIAGSCLREVLDCGSNETEVEKIIFINFNEEQDEPDSQSSIV